MARKFIDLLTLAARTIPSACSGVGASDGDGGAPATFQFRTSEDITLAIAVRKAGLPLAGATVTIAAPLTNAGAEAGEPSTVSWFTGGTDDDGRCSSTLALPAHVQQVDVIVQHAGSRGDYTDEALRTLWGPFAPSARVTVSVTALPTLVLDLEDA